MRQPSFTDRARSSRTLTRAGLLAAACSLLTLVEPPAARALDSLEITAPAAPGGGWDQTARSMQQALQSSGIVQNVEVVNIPGAGGTIGLAQFANRQRGRDDALLVTGLVMVGAVLTNRSPVSLEQATPIARLTGEYEVIVVPAASKLRTMRDLVAALEADPGAVSWAGGSAGGTDHILVGLLAQEAGVDPTRINYVPFSGGGEALAALLGNQVTAGVSGYGEFAAQIEAGKLRALAISSEKRLPGIDIPTLREQGVGVDLANWRGIVAPPGLSGDERKGLLDAVDRMVRSDAWQSILRKNEWTDLYLPGDEFAEFLEAERARVEKVLRSIGLVG